MNIIIFPFHDMRKNQREGYRNRDSHFIEQFSYNKNVEKVLIINRPITIAEMIYKRTTWRTIGQVIYQTSRVRLVKNSSQYLCIRLFIIRLYW